MINALTSAEKRQSVNISKVNEAPLTGRLSHQMTPPPRINTSPVSSVGGQLFLCVIGSLLSLSVCVWLAFFSTDLKIRRMIFAAAAAICAAMFTLLGIASIKKNTKHTHVEISPTMLRNRCSLTNNCLRRDTKSGEELLARIEEPLHHKHLNVKTPNKREFSA